MKKGILLFALIMLFTGGISTQDPQMVRDGFNDAIGIAVDTLVSATADSTSLTAPTYWEPNNRAFLVSVAGDTAYVYVFMNGYNVNLRKMSFILGPEQSLFLKGLAVSKVSVRFYGTANDTIIANIAMMGNK